MVEAAVGLSPVSNGPSNGESGALSGENALVVQVSDVDLNGGVVLGSNQSVAPRAERITEKRESDLVPGS